AAGRGRGALLGAAQRGGDRSGARMLGQRGQSRRRTRSPDAQGGPEPRDGPHPETLNGGSRIMSRNDVERDSPEAEAALRDIMSNSVSGIRMPPDLADRAVGRDRRRKARIRLTGAVSATAAAAAVATAIVIPGQSGGQAPGPQTPGAHVQTAALVLSRAAAAQVDSRHLI